MIANIVIAYSGILVNGLVKNGSCCDGYHFLPMVPGDEEGGVACYWFVPQNFRIDDNYPNETIRDVTSTAMICFAH